MRILYLTMAPPLPARSGYSVRIQTIATVLAELAELRFLVLGQTEDAHAVGPTTARFQADFVLAPPRPKAAKAMVHLKAVAANRNRWMEKYRTGRLRAEAIAAISAFQPDIVIAGGLAVLSLAESFGLAPDRLVLDHHNVETVNYARMAETHRGLARLAASWDRQAFAALEQSAVGVRDHWAVSEPDRAALEEILQRPVVTIPNVAQESAFAVEPKGLATGAPAVLGFMASYDYPPNLEAAFEICRIMEILRAQGADCDAVLMGGGASDALHLAAKTAGVGVTGFVDDPRDVYERFSLLLAPIRSGGGTKLKIIEALAMGLPVVTTPTGAEGIPLVEQDLGIVVETNQELADACTTLLCDRDRLMAMGRRARAWARANASLETLRRLLPERLAAIGSAEVKPPART